MKKSFIEKTALFGFLLMLSPFVCHGRVFKLAIEAKGSAFLGIDSSLLRQQPHLPILAIPVGWPCLKSELLHRVPQFYSRILLDADLASIQSNDLESSIFQLKQSLKAFPNIKYLVLRGLDWNKWDSSGFILKKISTAARGLVADIKIGIAVDYRLKRNSVMDQVKKIISSGEIRPYFQALYLSSTSLQVQIQKHLLKVSPNLEIWQTLRDILSPSLEPGAVLSELLKINPFEKINTSIFVVPARHPVKLVKPLASFASVINLSLYKYKTTTKIMTGSGQTWKLRNFIKPTDQSILIFCYFSSPDRMTINIRPKSYITAIIINLVSGTARTVSINKNDRQLSMGMKKGFYTINFIPGDRTLTDSSYTLSITGESRPSAAEVIAKVRVWQESMKSKLTSFIAQMSSSLRLRIANLNETFDLTIKGPMFSERGKPYDWLWKEFYLNGVKWKSKKVPKIPLLQPEKVHILPVDLSFSEEYRYSYVRETRLAGHPVHVISFKPRKVYRRKSSYYGTLWIDKDYYFPRKEHLVQINLKGEVLSNTETRFYRQIGNDPRFQLPVRVKGHQVFSIAGRVTDIEKETILSQIEINPADLANRRKKAYQTDFQMVRDTRLGLRYLLKNQKNKKRQVEWKVKKSQLLWVLGGFFDSSLSFPIPIIGINYLNFDLGGKGRQLNILFGGAMLTANFTDPALFGSKIDLGANLTAIALPFNNSICRNNQKIESETVKRWPLKFQINTGFPLGPYFKLSNFLFLNYDHFSKADNTSPDFILPKSTISYGLRSRLTVNLKGYKISLSGAVARRAEWAQWGLPGNPFYNPGHDTYYRWRFTIAKDFFLRGFKKLHLQLGYYDGLDLDRFSSYRFGFFNELRMHGFMSGVVQATRAYMLNLSYGYNIGSAFRLEFSYDSALITNKFNEFHNTYFSSTSIAGTMNIPGINVICRFEAGMPVYSRGIRGFVLYLVLMKML